jgi:NAD(P)-dependent dehydrogenase (short-subunit alcohol dehydrogenase family)
MALDAVSSPAALFDITGKTALVTGGSRGIGFMIAHGLAQAGARLVIASRSEEELDEAAERLRQVGDVGVVPADLSSPEGAAALAQAVRDRFETLSILINNAGTSLHAPLEEFPASGWDTVMRTNVEAVFHLTVGLLPALRGAASSEDPARVINIGSVDGIQLGPLRDHYSYSASKAAVHMLTRHLAKRLAPEQITVNAIAPGPFPSKLTARVLDDPETRKAIEASVPLGRLGRADDAAGLALFLASRAGSYLTGTVISLDGGLAGCT